MSAITSTNPARPDDVVAQSAATTSEGVADAVESATGAFATWSASTGLSRAAALEDLAAAIEARSDRLGALVSREVGKPVAEAEAEAARAVAIVRYHAQSALDADGETYPPGPGVALLMSRRRPHGVCALVTPWNFPLAIPLWKAAPALAAGNVVLLKPASAAIGCAAELADLFAETLPANVAQVLPGGADTAEPLLEHPDVRCVSFTGSSPVGNSIVARATGRGIPVQAEMGGQNPSIVLADADLDLASATIANAAMGYAGQKCTATGRVIVERRIADDFVPLLAAAVEQLQVGDPADADTIVGPLIDEGSRAAALEAIEAATADGGELIVGGQTSEPGWALQPTLVSVNTADSALAQEEVFAPVAAVLQADDAENAIRMANSVRFGLCAAVFTRSLAGALSTADRLDAGMVRVNQSTAGVDLHAPFGGLKESSFGAREQGRAARAFYTTSRTITVAGV